MVFSAYFHVPPLQSIQIVALICKVFKDIWLGARCAIPRVRPFCQRTGPYKRAQLDAHSRLS